MTSESFFALAIGGTLAYVLLAAVGAIAQVQSTRHLEIETYNRLTEVTGAEPVPVGGPIA